jgi:hypothetical protein
MSFSGDTEIEHSSDLELFLRADANQRNRIHHPVLRAISFRSGHPPDSLSPIRFV